MSRSLVGHQLANGSLAVPITICMICDRDCDRLYVVYSRPTIGAQTPFFPILESLSGNSSQINCCHSCSQSLLHQWNEYESKQIAIKNRFYHLNRKTTFNTKTSLSSNNSTKQLNQNNGHSVTPEEVLDLSFTTSSVGNSNPIKNNLRNEINCKQWTPNRLPTICYICGEECPTVVSVLVRRTANCPYFPSLLSHSKPNGANPIDANGRIDSCESCHRFLIQQWDHFQRINVPISERQYDLRANTSIGDRNRHNRYACVLCNTEFSLSIQSVVISMLTLNDFNSDLKKLILSSAQEFIVGSGVTLELGRVLTCINCFRDLIKNSNPTAPQMTPPLIPTPETKKKTNLDLNTSLNEQHLCPLCHRIKNQSFLVETNPTLERKPFFPFLKDIVKTQELDSLERVKICNICLSCLESQWEAFEVSLIPHNQRNYVISSRASPVARSLSPPALKIVVSSPPPLQQSLVCEPLLTTVTTLTTQSHNTYCTTNSSKQYLHKNESRISGPMDDILLALGGPLHRSANCAVCGEYSVEGHIFQLFSSPRVPPIINHELGIHPFFPFLKKLLITNEERDLDNRSNCSLVCTFCFHSLIGQWMAYNTSPYFEDKDPMRRTYNCRDYICYICGVTTFRQRVRSIALKDFPFLLEHSRPPGALTLSNGESVVTCLTCFDSLTLQWKDYERMKVPIEMRKYNWITVAPPNRDLTHNDLSVSSVHNVNGSLSPPTLISMNQTSKLMSNIENNQTLSANRGSSFSDALRKLAKQTFEQSVSGDARGQQNLVGLSKTALPFQSPYQSPSIRPSPPIVTIAPIAAHQTIDRSNEMRKLDNSSFYEHRIHSEIPKESLLYSHSQRTSPIVQIRPSPSRVHNECLSSTGNHTTTATNLSNRSSGFQPYRTGFEESSSAPGLPSAPLPSHLLPYEALAFPYHPFLGHSAQISGANPVPHPSASYRSLSDNYYLDRLGLMRGSGLVPTGPGLGPTGSGSTGSGSSAVPYNLVRYSDLLSSQTERLINDERQRILNQSLSQNSYKPSAQPIETPVHHLASNGTQNNGINGRVMEAKSEQIFINHSVKPEFSGNHLNSGSILSGTPRDVSSGPTPNLNRRPNVSNISAVKPLNLSSNSEQPILQNSNSMSNSEPTYLWRPQSDERKEQHNNNSNNHFGNSNQIVGHSSQTQTLHSETTSLNRRNSSFLIEDSVQTKSFNRNCFENTEQFSETNRSIDTKVMKPVMCLPTERHNSEGLHSRILENNSLERSVANDLNHILRPEMTTNCEQLKKRQSENGRQPEERVISKLDLKEMKLKEKRMNRINGSMNQLISDNSDSDQSVSDADSDDSEDNCLKYNIILSKRMPLELDTNEDKMQFLGIFKLTTHKRKSQIEFNKYVKRRKIFNQLSTDCLDSQLSSTVSCVSMSESIDENKENPDLVLTSSSISPDWMVSQENKMEVKIHFMSTLGLCQQTSNERKTTVELLWTGITKERQIRIKRNKCWIKVLNNLSEDTVHKWLISLQSSANASHSSEFDNRLHHSNGFIGNNLISNSKPLINCSFDSSNSSRFHRKVILFNKQTNDSNNCLQQMSNRSRIHSNKDFAQEFHESVLLETAKQQQSRQHNQQHNQQQQQTQPIVRHYADFSSSSGYKWPGIETIMESYDKYSYERNQEKDFLLERTTQLKNKLQDINREAEYLNEKMANLIQTKSHLDDERQHFETTLDALKTCLRQFR